MPSASIACNNKTLNPQNRVCLISKSCQSQTLKGNVWRRIHGTQRRTSGKEVWTWTQITAFVCHTPSESAKFVLYYFSLKPVKDRFCNLYLTKNIDDNIGYSHVVINKMSQVNENNYFGLGLRFRNYTVDLYYDLHRMYVCTLIIKVKEPYLSICIFRSIYVIF